MQDRRAPPGRATPFAALAFKWLGLVRLPRSSKVLACQQTLRTYFRVDPVVVYLFIELSLDWRQTALGSILSHTQKRVVKDMI